MAETKEAPPAKRAKTEESEDVAEENVGITAYANAAVAGFSGILKDRYCDFIVNEVDPNGTVVRLRDVTSLPASDAAEAEESKRKKAEGATTEESLAEIVGAEQAKSFAEFAADEAKPPSKAKFEFAAESDRAKRTAVHAAIKAWPGNMFDTGTDNGRIFVTRGRPSVRHKSWSKDRRYLAFTLYKENMDTQTAVQMLSRKLGMRAGLITMAGNKDKRAITTQRMTVLRVEAQKLQRLNGFMGPVLTGDYAYVPQPLRLGDLQGNRFELAIRDIDATDDAVREAVESLKVNGFVNYFGLQRFGTGTVRTHEIGIALLKEDWAEAVSLIMRPHNKASEAAIRARELFAEGELEKCAALLPRSMHIEATIVDRLIRDGPKAYRNALDGLPKTTRLLYLHAYQSFVWNKMASQRLLMFGNTVVPGDLVVTSPQQPIGAPSTTPEGDDSSAPPAAADEGDTAAGDAPAAEVEDSTKDDSFAQVKALTAEDIATGKYTIFDVVLPLPGAESVYPKNSLADAYTEALRADGLSQELISSRRGLYHLRGGYRTVLERPHDVEWRVVPYTDPLPSLLSTDAERVRGLKVEQQKPPEEGQREMRALCIAFTLRSSSYATMCYRELLKQHTSMTFQTKLQSQSRQGAQQQ